MIYIGKTKILNVRPQNFCVFGANWANWEIENLNVKSEKKFFSERFVCKNLKIKKFLRLIKDQNS
jgi:hypothetical protein